MAQASTPWMDWVWRCVQIWLKRGPRHWLRTWQWTVLCLWLSTWALGLSLGATLLWLDRSHWPWLLLGLAGLSWAALLWAAQRLRSD